MIDAIAFKYRTACPWMDLPERFGSWKGVHNRLRKWAADGTWEKVYQEPCCVTPPTINRHHPRTA